jgi:hypothetical protein
MPALFPPWSNTTIRVALAALVVFLVGSPGAIMIYMRSPYGTGQGYEIPQPVEFDHRHHVGDDGIDCRYCHSAVETGPYAGVPPTKVCMGCHNQIWNDVPLLEPVRRSAYTGEPIQWRRVHDLPDFVYFNHSIHVNEGVGCVDCHGRVDQMSYVRQVKPLTMSWCLDCHRKQGDAVRRITSCTACHR